MPQMSPMASPCRSSSQRIRSTGASPTYGDAPWGPGFSKDKDKKKAWPKVLFLGDPSGLAPFWPRRCTHRTSSRPAMSWRCRNPLWGEGKKNPNIFGNLTVFMWKQRQFAWFLTENRYISKYHCLGQRRKRELIAIFYSSVVNIICYPGTKIICYIVY